MISAEIIVAVTGLLATGGAGVAWLVNRMDRQKAIMDGKVARLESRYATLRIAFQMVANELARHDPQSAVLARAQMLLLRDYGEPVVDNALDDLVAKLA